MGRKRLFMNEEDFEQDLDLLRLISLSWVQIERVLDIPHTTLSQIRKRIHYVEKAENIACDDDLHDVVQILCLDFPERGIYIQNSY